MKSILYYFLILTFLSSCGVSDPGNPKVKMFTPLTTAILSSTAPQTQEVVVEPVKGITITKTSSYSEIMEGVQPISYDIVLISEPGSAVNVSVEFDPAQLIVNGYSTSPYSISFDSTNWNVVQSITIYGVFDNVYEGNHTSTYKIKVLSDDSGFTGTNTYTANLTDNEGSKLLSNFISGSQAGFNTTTTASLGTTVDISKSFAYCNFKLNSSNVNYPATCQLKSTGTDIELFAGTNTGAGSNVDWYVASFSKGAFVQRGSTTLGIGTNSQEVTLSTAIDLSRTFLILYSRTSTSSVQNKDEERTVMGKFTSSNTIQFSRNQSTTLAVDVEWQAVQLDGAKVISGTKEIADGESSASISISPINQAHSFLIFSSKAGAGIGGIEREYYFTGSVTSSTSLQFKREGNQGKAEISYYAIEMVDGASVQSGSFVIPSANTSKTVDISTVDTGKTMIILSNSIANTDAASQDSGTFYAKFLNSTQIEFARNNAESNTGTLNWFTINFQ